MRNKTVLMFGLMFLLFCSVSCCRADSIWAKRDKNMKELYSDDVAHRIGDVLTIEITEDSKVDNKANRDLKKEAARSTTFDGGLGIELNNHNIWANMPGFTMEAESSNELKGQADYKDERSFTDCITAVVEDILPNGNLVVVGARTRDIGGEKQIIEVSGIVRPSDIAFDNTVQSEQVANFCIVTKHTGLSESYNRQGWLGAIFDAIWPF